eukprot:UN02992
MVLYYEPIEVKCQLLTIPLTTYLDIEATTNFISGSNTTSIVESNLDLGGSATSQAITFTTPQRMICYKGLDSIRAITQSLILEQLIIEDPKDILLSQYQQTLILTRNTNVKKFILHNDLINKLKFAQINKMYSIAPFTAQILLNIHDQESNHGKDVVPILSIPSASLLHQQQQQQQQQQYNNNSSSMLSSSSLSNSTIF